MGVSTMKKQRTIDRIALTFLILGSVVMLAPFVWTISTSLKAQNNVFQVPPQWIPDPIHFQNYIDIWNQVPLLNGFINTTIIVFFVLTIGLFTSTMAAFAFSKFDFPLREILFLGLLGTMMIPYAVQMIPQFIGFSALGWVDTLLPLIVPGLFGNITVIFFLRQYLQGAIPNELLDAARIDGCSFFKMFTIICIPIAKPAIAAQAALGFMGIWNDFLGPLIYLHSPRNQTIQVLIASMQSQYISQSNFPIIMAAAVVTMIPVIIIFLFSQRYFLESLAITGIKG